MFIPTVECSEWKMTNKKKIFFNGRYYNAILGQRFYIFGRQKDFPDQNVQVVCVIGA